MITEQQEIDLLFRAANGLISQSVDGYSDNDKLTFYQACDIAVKVEYVRQLGELRDSIEKIAGDIDDLCRPVERIADKDGSC